MVDEGEMEYRNHTLASYLLDTLCQASNSYRHAWLVLATLTKPTKPTKSTKPTKMTPIQTKLTSWLPYRCMQHPAVTPCWQIAFDGWNTWWLGVILAVFGHVGGARVFAFIHTETHYLLGTAAFVFVSWSALLTISCLIFLIIYDLDMTLIHYLLADKCKSGS